MLVRSKTCSQLCRCHFPCEADFPALSVVKAVFTPLFCLLHCQHRTHHKATEKQAADCKVTENHRNKTKASDPKVACRLRFAHIEMWAPKHVARFGGHHVALDHITCACAQHIHQTHELLRHLHTRVLFQRFRKEVAGTNIHDCVDVHEVKHLHGQRCHISLLNQTTHMCHRAMSHVGREAKTSHVQFR